VNGEPFRMMARALPVDGKLIEKVMMVLSLWMHSEPQMSFQNANRGGGSRNAISVLRLFISRRRNDDFRNRNWSQLDIDQERLAITARRVVSQNLSCLFFRFRRSEGSRLTSWNIMILFPIALIFTFTGRLFLGLVCQWTSCLWPATSYLNAVFTNIKRRRDSHPCRDEFIKKHV
jgi:hypothetical protein